MRNRFLKVALATVLAAVIGVVLVCPEPVAAQSVSAKLRAKEVTKDEAWTPPRTPDGQPDIQGIFTNASVVPLERPKDLGSREFFTKAEADTYTAKVLSQREVVAPGTYGDVHYNKAQFGLEKGQTKVPEAIRTSLIVGPEGRVPRCCRPPRQELRRKQQRSRGMNSTAPRIAPSPSNAFCGQTKVRPCFPRATTATSRSCRVKDTWPSCRK